VALRAWAHDRPGFGGIRTPTAFNILIFELSALPLSKLSKLSKPGTYLEGEYSADRGPHPLRDPR
jgi:hypothetical protein